MNFSDTQLQDLTQQAISAALAAGHLINAHRDTGVEVHKKETGTSTAAQVVTEVDHKAQAAILAILQPLCDEYGLALLTEESPDSGQRQQRPAFWSIDPMDGTLNFINGQPGFSVSIALVAKNGIPLLGVVYDPVEKNLYQAVRNAGAYRNGELIKVPERNPEQPLVLRTDFSFQNDPLREKTLTGLQDVAQKLGLTGADIQYRNGAVLNACGILEDPNICYFKYPKSGGGSLWDYAATACLFQETGAIASDIYGQSMELNRQGSTFMNHRGLLYANDRTLADHIVALYRSIF